MYCVVQIGSRMFRFECGTTRSTWSCALALKTARSAARRARRRMRESPAGATRGRLTGHGRHRNQRLAVNRGAKSSALALLAALSLLSPALEMAITGRVEMFSSYGLAETAVSLVLLFWWYHLDKADHDYQAGRLMNAGVLLLALVALPIYFVRSRGWRRGARASALAALFLGATFVLGELGERFGTLLRS